MVVEIILIMMIIAAPSSALNSSVLSLESSSYADPFVLLGVFSVLKDRATRDAIRNSFLRNSAVCNYRTPRGRYRKKQGRQPCISVRFVLGHDYSNEAKDEALRRKEQAENGGDLFVIPIHENMNSGKSPAFLKAVALSGLPETVAFVGKSDTDTFIWPNRIIEELLRLPPPPEWDPLSNRQHHRLSPLRRPPPLFLSDRLFVHGWRPIFLVSQRRARGVHDN